MVLRGSSEAAGVAPCRAGTERGRAEAASLEAAPFSRECVFTQAVTWGFVSPAAQPFCGAFQNQKDSGNKRHAEPFSSRRLITGRRYCRAIGSCEPGAFF